MIPKEVLKKIRQIQIRSRHVVNDVFAGQYHSVFKGQGMEFEEVREYIPGDDIRSIDWNVTARSGIPHIKKFVEERELTVMLLVDVSGSHDFGSSRQLKKDLAAELAAILAFSAIRNNDRVGLILFSDDIELYVPPDKGTSHVLRVIREVLYFKPKGTGTSIQAGLDFLNRVTTRKTVSFVISDFLDQDYQKALRITARRHDLIAAIIADRREDEFPPVGVVSVVDTETGKSRLIDTSSPAFREKLRIRQEAARKQLHADLQASGVDPIQFYAGEPYEREFVRFFRMRERRMKS